MKNPYISKRKAVLHFMQIAEVDNIERLFLLVVGMDISQTTWDEFVNYLLEKFNTEIYEIAKALPCFVPYVSAQMRKCIHEALISHGAVQSVCLAKQKSDEGISTAQLCMLTVAVIAHHRENELEALLSEIRTMSIRHHGMARELGELLNPAFCHDGKKLNVIAEIGMSYGMDNN